MLIMVFFFKQKTAYEMRISDWSSDVCSSDLLINPWGVSFAPTGPFWVSNQGSATSTLYNGDGSPVPLVVTIRLNAPGPASTRGQSVSGDGTLGIPVIRRAWWGERSG